jgi:hypothetical protein
LGSLEGELKAFWEKWPDGKLITVDVIVNNVAVANALINTGSAAYCFVSSKFVEKNDLKRIRLPEVCNGYIQLEHVSTKDMAADGLTKLLNHIAQN